MSWRGIALAAAAWLLASCALAFADEATKLSAGDSEDPALREEVARLAQEVARRDRAGAGLSHPTTRSRRSGGPDPTRGTAATTRAASTSSGTGCW